MAKSLIRAARTPIGRSRLLTLLKPMDNGPREIRALDGLRAAAATSIVVFHALHAANFQYSPASRAFGNLFWFLATGVHLFFVLSGFLLFLPFARAILLDQPLPSARRFYWRRALRILPAYILALLILAWLPSADHVHPTSAPSIITHLLMIHDMFPAYNRDFEGPFWTLAIEGQFYLLLPFMAAALARIVGRSRSFARLLGGIGLLIALALALRALDIVIMAGMPARTSDGFARAFVRVTMGMQGKYLEVFLTGMLASVMYVVTVELHWLDAGRQRRLGWIMLCSSAAIILLAIPNIRFGGTIFAPGAEWGIGVLFYPLIVGAGYATLLLAILWGSRSIRWLFETPPIGFIGRISYSLYLWHLPVLLAMIPFFAGAPLLLRCFCTAPIAYLSYQLVERPFLKRRRRQEIAATTAAPVVRVTGDKQAQGAMRLQSPHAPHVMITRK